MNNKRQRPTLGQMRSVLRERMWRPPRPHGEVIEDHNVSFLELFYDLVYVVLIGRIAHTLTHHISWGGVLDFAAVFGMIWIAWFNGTMYQQVHGSSDLRSRNLIFLQMLLLVTLAPFTAEATSDRGAGFAVVYVLLLLVYLGMWGSVYRRDPVEYRSSALRYLQILGISMVPLAVSIFLPDSGRVVVWALVVVGWFIGGTAQGKAMARGEQPTAQLTDAIVERFGLFTIIVLGEVVIGVAAGLSDIELDARTVATALLGLGIGFGFWWTYFDFVSRRLPKERFGILWMFMHLPITLAIAAGGAAMVTLLEHAGDARAPSNAAWLLSGSVAVMLVMTIPLLRTLANYEARRHISRPLMIGLGVAAVAAVVVGAFRPAPWLLYSALNFVLFVPWVVGLYQWISYVPVSVDTGDS